MLERRRSFRFEPTCAEEEQVTLEGDIATGVVGNLSREGICVIVLPDVDFAVDQEVTVDYRGHVAQAVVRNITHDAIRIKTAAGGRRLGRRTLRGRWFCADRCLVRHRRAPAVRRGLS